MMIRMAVIGTAALLACATTTQACPGLAEMFANVVTASATDQATDLSAAKKRKPAARRAARRPASGAGGAGGGSSPAGGGMDKPSSY
jgi:hypothetical protein